MDNDNLLIVNSQVLPSVFKGVIRAKEMLASGQASSTSEAAKLACISRSAFYKYRDFVFKYTENDTDSVSINAKLDDKAGVFSALTTALYKYGANIIKLNQEVPVNGVATASITIKIDNIGISLQDMIKELNLLNGIISVKLV